MEIKKVTNDDIKQIVLLEEEAFKETLGENLISESIKHPNMNFICMKEGLKVLGYLGTYIFDNEVELLNFVVDKEFRGKGIGTKLINYFLQDDSYQIYCLEVRVSNSNAVNFYKNKGFKEVSIRKNYYSNGEDAYLMILNKNEVNI